MEDPPRDYNICPSCGTEFGLHDVNASIEELRIAWLQRGPKWWSPVDCEPVDWDPLKQLQDAGLSSSSAKLSTGTATTAITASADFNRDWVRQAHMEYLRITAVNPPDVTDQEARLVA